ncbi:MAG TPA: serine/threonine-protein kinase [Bryobacteraceae bacterium]|jgi:serine/threonine protein kinase|nr:serine/threonine-protein kinase [Bryobacteraceae bacterium]
MKQLKGFCETSDKWMTTFSRTMTNPPFDEIRARLDEHASLPRPDRQKFLEETCGRDESLRSLASRLYDEKFGTVGSASPDPPPAAASYKDWQIGPYRVERELGRGGMGVVLLASRADQQYRKQVAIKLLRPGHDGEHIFRRFQNERQILANLEHPNICRLLDGGVTEDGEPYFVMEHVRNARPIDEYCTARDLGLNERLELFRQACAAVQYAHRFLIVHRDLKPSNILVTDEGVVKLMDFGIAKNLLAGFDDPSPQTLGIQPMTPAYASPEQLRGEAISTASDVYSLGVVLYELLTGHRPFESAEKGLPNMVQSICEEDPERPSITVLRPRPDSLASIRTGKPGEGFIERLRGDLDWIILMALRKDPMRRYVSVEQLSEDIRKYMAGLPVIARGDTFSYRAGKFLRRNRLAVFAVATIFVTLLGGVLSTRREQARTKARFNDVRALANSILFEISDAIRDLPGSTPARLLLVERAQTYLDKLAHESGDDPSLERELAEAYKKVGEVQYRVGYPNLGDINGALASARKELTLRERISAGDQSVSAKLAVADAHVRLGELLDGSADPQSADSHIAQALQIREALYAEHPKNVDVRSDLARSYRVAGDREKMEGHAQAFYDLNQKALTIREGLLAEHPSDEAIQRQYSMDLVRIGDSLGSPNETNLGRYDEARNIYERALQIREALAMANPSNAVGVRDVSNVYQRLGSLLEHIGRYDESLEMSKKGLSISDRLFDADPANFEVRRDIIVFHDQLGRAYIKLADYGAAEKSLRTSLDIASELIAKNPGSERSRDDQAQSAYLLGLCLAASQRDQEALEDLKWSTATWDNLLAKHQDSGRYKVKMMRAMAAIAEIHVRQKDIKAARDEYQRAYDLSLELRNQGRLGQEDRDMPERLAAQSARLPK